MKTWALAAITALTTVAGSALAQDGPMGPLRPDQVAFRSLYKELVETNTTLSAGSCTLAAERMAARLKTAGFAEPDVIVFTAPDHPKEGGLVAVLHGASKTAKPMLLLGHLDVVEAKREDWTRDPFTLVEENNYLYGRGTTDMKVIDAIWVDMLARFKQGGLRPKRDIKLALTCGEESAPFNGAGWLAKTHPEWISAAFALNEGGGGFTDGHGKLLQQTLQVGEKSYQDFRIETTNVGGHSSIPVRDNAIYALSSALLKIRDYAFPLKMTDTTRAYFAKAGAARGDDIGQAMVALAKNPDDKAADALASSDRMNNSMLRTTCVATLLDGGHAVNALPQRASANINCRIFPGETAEQTAATLTKVIGDPGVKVTARPTPKPPAVSPPLDPKIVNPAEKLVAQYFPGVPLIPLMVTAATDAPYLEAIGIPVYGAPGPWSDPDFNGIHGLNERQSARSLYIGRDFLTDLVKLYAETD